jgi:hypothetical protein
MIRRSPRRFGAGIATLPDPDHGSESREEKNGVDDGIRTHDHLDHNQGLCQLSYIHHQKLRFWHARQDSNLRPAD